MERATLLVFGDNTAALELIENSLRQRGHRVLATNNPSEALEIGRRVGIDLLISDVVAGGPALVKQLAAIQPTLRVLYLFDADHPDPPEDNVATFLRKPVALDELEAAVAATLEPGT